MLFKESLIWALWGQNVGPGWVKNGKKGCFHTSHLNTNPVFSIKQVLNKSPNTLSRLKDELTDLHKILQKLIFY